MPKVNGLMLEEIEAIGGAALQTELLPWLVVKGMTTTLEAPASTAAAMDALDQRLSQRFIALDPSGYFLIA